MQFVFTLIRNLYDKHEVIPSRAVIKDTAAKYLTADDDWQSVMDVVDRASNPREIPVIKENLISWAKERAYAMLYEDDGMDAYSRGDYEHLDEIIETARQITDVSSQGMWFFDQPIIENLFSEGKD